MARTTQAKTALPDAGLCNNTALRKATRRVSLLYDLALAPCGLRSTQRSILIHIHRPARRRWAISPAPWCWTARRWRII